MARLYTYVGPPEIARSARSSHRALITCDDDVRKWIATSGRPPLTVTFVIDAHGELWIADRQSEHVACARGEPVRSAGEMTFDIDDKAVDVTYVTNQSTGFCPEPESWHSVARALDRARITHPDDFDMRCEFRRCTCGQINLVKNEVYECGVCGSELPREWNLATDNAL